TGGFLKPEGALIPPPKDAVQHRMGVEVHYKQKELKEQQPNGLLTGQLSNQVTVQTLLKTERLFGITVPAGRSRSVKNVADTKLFASQRLAKSKYRRFSRPAFTVTHKKAGLGSDMSVQII
ncbi:MAG: hypothetical protein J6E41_06315, partial [Lachnospiraceae bacterium]|nr:hypothetical protein [Lachnospiraceae bacterium]